MPISFGKPREDDVVSLIAAKKYARAIEVLKAQLQKKGANPSLRMQLADVLILADKRQEAVALLLPLADQYARDGFAAKAVSVLKKVQKVDPGRRDVEERLARQIEEKQREAAVRPRATALLGMEEAPDGPAATIPDASPSLEIGFESMAPVSAPVEVLPPPVAPPPAPAWTSAAPAEPLPPPREAPPPRRDGPDATLPVSSPLVSPLLEEGGPRPALVAPPAGPLPAPPAAEEGVEDYDLLYAGGDNEDEDEEIEVPLEAEIVEEARAAPPMSAGQFADELMGLVDSVFQEFSAAPPASASVPATSASAGTFGSAAASASAAPAASSASPFASPSAGAPEPSRGGSQIVVSPLFRSFSVDEMVAVIQGLKLLSFERGGVILREGQPGGSLYTLTSGRVRAFKRNPTTGKQDALGDLKEGAFFGEMSILTGQPRMASVVALTRCELLELDRATLDGITKTHPHVWDVLREFAEQRAAPAGR